VESVPLETPVYGPPTQKEYLLDQIPEEGATPEERAAISQRFSGLVDTVISWAGVNDHAIETVEPLEGGFKNPVVMLTTAKGEQFVAKGFTEEESLATTTRAKTILNSLFTEDSRLIPKSEVFNSTLFSEKAKGSTIRSLIKSAVEDPTQTGRAVEAFQAVGATLGMIHERTERPVKGMDDLPLDVVEHTIIDQEKVIKHIEDLKVSELIDLEPQEIEAIEHRIVQLTEPEYVSLVHGDAHLGQFYHEKGGATVEVVDYDDIREGDPMADLARLIASQRDWCQAYGASDELDTELTRAIARGYESTRRESDLIPGEGEVDSMRVVAYELRLYLVKLKAFGDLRQELKVLGGELGLDESEIMTASKDQDVVINRSLSPKQRSELVYLRSLASEIKDIMLYLRPIRQEERHETEHRELIAA
jgi:hypothetical protein